MKESRRQKAAGSSKKRTQELDRGQREVIANCGFKNSMLDAGYSMLDKDLPFTDPPPAENLTPENYPLALGSLP